MELTETKNTTDHPHECSWVPPHDEIILYVFLNILFSCLAVCSNFVFMFAVFKTPNLQTVSNFFLCSLALADFSAGLFVNSLYSCIVLFGVSPSGLWLSKVEKFVWIQTLVCNTFSLALVSIDRYIAVLYPLKYYTIINERRCFFSIMSVWVLSIVLALPAPFISEKGVAVLWSIGGVISVVFPFIIISYCYFHIFGAVRRQATRVEPPPDSVVSQSGQIRSVTSAQRQQKAAVTTSIIVVFFIVLFSPNIVFAFLYALAEEGCDQAAVLRSWLWGVLVAYSGSFINPWIYGLRSKEFRNAFNQMFRCRN
ncbi:adrenocorticotropic hormone receptor-like [Actinia tenebrosa]|uniref:Adrenocorticotropic hormone receptor-like n=1 Tax=Actinia tenebrosa TaxID=6105 RepID=A0A6P8I9U4_ACTTE|nr:adrenocorticotropic hormone receptor-like [Actinia tenebrosa]